MRNERQVEQTGVTDGSGTQRFKTKTERGPTRETTRVLADIQFAPGSAALFPASRSRLNQFVDWVRHGHSDGDSYIEMEGQAGATDADEHGRIVARARAEVVRRYLCTRMRLPIDRIGIVEPGSFLPPATDRASEGRRPDGRVVVLVLRS